MDFDLLRHYCATLRRIRCTPRDSSTSSSCLAYWSQTCHHLFRAVTLFRWSFSVTFKVIDNICNRASHCQCKAMHKCFKMSFSGFCTGSVALPLLSSCRLHNHFVLCFGFTLFLNRNFVFRSICCFHSSFSE